MSHKSIRFTYWCKFELKDPDLLYDRESSLSDQYISRWFHQKDIYDQQAAKLFYKDFKSLDRNKNEFDNWCDDPLGRLALIILCDQLSRFVYRGSKKSLKYDSIALNLSKKIVQEGSIKNYKIVEQIFIIMPFMHSESKKDCQKSI